jgi:hypothetical protein
MKDWNLSFVKSFSKFADFKTWADANDSDKHSEAELKEIYKSAGGTIETAKPAPTVTPSQN